MGTQLPRHVEDGNPHDALRCAFWLAFGLMQQGDTAQAGGWLADAGQLADGLGLDCVDCGYLMAPAALMGLSRGEFVAALDGFTAAGAVAEQFDDADDPGPRPAGDPGRGSSTLSRVV